MLYPEIGFFSLKIICPLYSHSCASKDIYPNGTNQISILESSHASKKTWQGSYYPLPKAN